MTDLLARIKGCMHELSKIVDELEVPPAPATPPPPTMHGATACEKRPHDLAAGAYLHGETFDGWYDIDGAKYCGRCHFAL